MKMNQRSRGGGYEQGERSSFGSHGGSPEGDRSGSRRAARRPGAVVGETQVCRNAAAAAWGRPETLSRELGVTAATLSGWREQFLEGGAANLKAREADVDNEETQRLKSLVADLSMSNELLREKIHRMEAGRPLVWRRPKP